MASSIAPTAQVNFFSSRELSLALHLGGRAGLPLLPRPLSGDVPLLSGCGEVDARGEHAHTTKPGDSGGALEGSADRPRRAGEEGEVWQDCGDTAVLG